LNLGVKIGMRQSRGIFYKTGLKKCTERVRVLSGLIREYLNQVKDGMLTMRSFGFATKKI
jgi:hypothetical protein